MNLYTDAEIGRVLKHRVCSRCYGDLMKKPAENCMWTVECPDCKQAWGGTTVSRFTVEKREQQALADMLDVRVTLADLFPSPHAGKNQEQLMRELGVWND